MSAYLGDFRVGKTIRKMWNSNAIAGESITRSGNGTLQVYKDGNTAQSTEGVTDTEDFDSLTGVHLISIDTSANGTFYSAASDFELVLANATIDGKTINASLFSFSLENRSPLMPTTADRKLDVNSNGEAGIDWANVGNQSATVGLSATTIASVGNVTGAVLGGMTGNITGNLSGSVGSIATGGITSASIATDAIDADALAADAIAEINATMDTALADIHLDHLLAVAYDPASKPGAADALLNELVESDAGVSRFTANALEQAPSGGGGVADWTADERTALRSILGIPASGTTPDDPSTGILDTIRDGIVNANSTLHAAVADVPTNSEFNARTLVAADYATAANLAAANTSISNANTTLLAAIDATPTISEFTARTLASADYATAANLAAANTSISNANSTILTAIGDVPTNSEFNARTLASADYATSANLAAANTSIGNANTSILAAVADVPTNSEFNARTLLAADYATAANLTLANTSIANANSTLHTAIADVPTVSEFTARTLATAEYATEAYLGDVQDVITDQIGLLNNISTADVNNEVTLSLAAIHLDKLLADTYDPDNIPGAVNALLNKLVESDSGVPRFTANALEQAPSLGNGSSLTAILTAIDDLPTNSEFNVRTLAAADYATAANLTAANTTLHAAIAAGSGANATAIADAVWDEALSGHTTSGTAGQLLGNLTLTAIADSVWDEATSGHSTAGTTGKALSDAGSAGDPWETAIGNGSTYAEGQAGQLLSKLRTEVANATVIVLPGDPIDDDLCHLYGQLVLPSGRLASAISLKLELGASTPIKLDSGRPVAYREVIARTDTDGYIISTAANGTIVQYQPIARTDKLSVGNASWSITSDALIFAQEEFYANGTTLDIATLI